MHACSNANSQGVEKKSSSATAAAGGAPPATEGLDLGAGTGGAAAAAAGDAMVAGFLREEGPGPVVDGMEAVPVPVPVAGLLSGDIPKLAKGSSSTGRAQQRRAKESNGGCMSEWKTGTNNASATAETTETGLGATHSAGSECNHSKHRRRRTTAAQLHYLTRATTTGTCTR